MGRFFSTTRIGLWEVTRNGFGEDSHRSFIGKRIEQNEPLEQLAQPVTADAQMGKLFTLRDKPPG